MILEAVLMQRLGYCAKAVTQRMSCCGTSLAGIPH